MDIGTVPSLGSFQVECSHYIPHSRQSQKKKRTLRPLLVARGYFYATIFIVKKYLRPSVFWKLLSYSLITWLPQSSSNPILCHLELLCLYLNFIPMDSCHRQTLRFEFFHSQWDSAGLLSVLSAKEQQTLGQTWENSLSSCLLLLQLPWYYIQLPVMVQTISQTMSLLGDFFLFI